MRLLVPLLGLLCLAGYCWAKQMSYQEALGLAQEGKADDQVLGAFRREHDKWLTATGKDDIVRKLELKVNLAALLLDLGNRAGDPSVFMPMYKEAEKLSKEALKHNPADSSASSNLKAAQSSMKLRAANMEDGAAPLDDDMDSSDSDSDSDEDEKVPPKDPALDSDSSSDEDDDEAPRKPASNSPPKTQATTASKMSEASDEEDDDGDDKAPSKPAAEKDADASATCKDGSCLKEAAGWLGAWAQDAGAWKRISSALKEGKIVVIKGFFSSAKADSIRTYVSRVAKVEWADRYGGSRRGGLAMTPQSKGWGDALKEAMDVVTGKEFRDKLSTGAGVSLDGPVPAGCVWLRPGEHERISNGATVGADGKEVPARVGLVVMLSKGWTDDLGGDFLWASPFASVPADFNTGILYPYTGVGRGVQMVERSGEGLKHLHLFATYTTTNAGKAKSLHEAQRKTAVKQQDSPGIAIDGATGSATKL